jgi:hypothetical protein
MQQPSLLNSSQAWLLQIYDVTPSTDSERGCSNAGTCSLADCHSNPDILTMCAALQAPQPGSIKALVQEQAVAQQLQVGCVAAAAHALSMCSQSSNTA